MVDNRSRMVCCSRLGSWSPPTSFHPAFWWLFFFVFPSRELGGPDLCSWFSQSSQTYSSFDFDFVTCPRWILCEINFTSRHRHTHWNDRVEKKEKKTGITSFSIFHFHFHVERGLDGVPVWSLFWTHSHLWSCKEGGWEVRWEAPLARDPIYVYKGNGEISHQIRADANATWPKSRKGERERDPLLSLSFFSVWDFLFLFIRLFFFREPFVLVPIFLKYSRKTFFYSRQEFCASLAHYSLSLFCPTREKETTSRTTTSIVVYKRKWTTWTWQLHLHKTPPVYIHNIWESTSFHTHCGILFILFSLGVD
jgi:hypothetical protein